MRSSFISGVRNLNLAFADWLMVVWVKGHGWIVECFEQGWNGLGSDVKRLRSGNYKRDRVIVLIRDRCLVRPTSIRMISSDFVCTVPALPNNVQKSVT